MSTKRITLCTSIAALGLLACICMLTQASEFDHQQVPFQAGGKSSEAELKFKVWNAARHSFYLNMYFTLGDPDDPGRNTDRDRVRKLAGSGGYNTLTKLPIDSGLAIPVRLTLVRLNGKDSELILDEVYQNPLYEGFSERYYSKLIVRYRLEPGAYKARIEALKDLPLLQTVPIQFDVHVAHDRL